MSMSRYYSYIIFSVQYRVGATVIIVNSYWIVLPCLNEQKSFPRGRHRASLPGRLSAAVTRWWRSISDLYILLGRTGQSRVPSLKCATIKKTSMERLLKPNLSKWSIITQIQVTDTTTTIKTSIIQMTTTATSKSGFLFPTYIIFYFLLSVRGCSQFLIN